MANGYVYVIGGATSTLGTNANTVYYARLNADGSTGAWQTNANTLPAQRGLHTSVVANGYVYVIGGMQQIPQSGTTTVYYAHLNADGSTGAWQTNANALPTGRAGHTSVIANGYVYVIGGATDAGNGANTVYYARLNANGSIGVWRTSNTILPTNRRNHGSFIANGYMYAIGGTAAGYTGTPTNTVYYASTSRLQVGAANLDLVGLQGQNLADGGDFSQGSTGGSLTAGNGTFVGSLQVQGQASFTSGAVIGGGLNVGGGAYVQNGATIESTAADTKGLVIKGATSQTANLQEWQNSMGTVMGSVSSSGQVLFKNDANSTTAFQVQNQAGGNLLQVDTSNNQVTVFGGLVPETDAWQTNANVLPDARDRATSVTANGYIYVIGGTNGSTGTNTVYYAQLNLDGSTGSWTTSANALPEGRSGHTSVVANGYAYVIGGTASGTGTNTVYYAQLNLDGTTGAWQTSVNTLPASRTHHTSVVANGYVYALGGSDGSASTNTVYYAELNLDGTTGAWQTAAETLPANRYYHNSVVANGYAYVIGGTASSTGTNTVYYAQLNLDGTTGVWQTSANTLPANRLMASSVIANGYVYLISGGTTSGGSGQSPAVYYAKLNPNGANDAWQVNSSSLPDNRPLAAATVVNGYIYVSGGDTNPGGTAGDRDTVYYAGIPLPSTRSLSVGGNLNLMSLYSQATAEEFGTAPVGGSVIALDGDFAGTLTAGGATTLQGGATIHAAADDQVGLVIQGASGQTANLQEWQDDGGSVLAFVSAAGDLSVVNATVTGTLTVTGAATFNAGITVNGHIITGNTSGVTTIGAEAGAGSGATIDIAGNDTAGTVTITTGTGAGTGTLATVTFANAYGANVRVVLTPANGNGASIQYFIGTAGTTTFTIDANDAPADATEYIYHYHVLQ